VQPTQRPTPVTATTQTVKPGRAEAPASVRSAKVEVCGLRYCRIGALTTGS